MMSTVRIYDAKGFLTYPPQQKDIKPDQQLRKIIDDVVDLYVDHEEPRIVAYVKARTSQIDHGNRSAFYHAEYAPADPDDLFQGLVRELNRLDRKRSASKLEQEPRDGSSEREKNRDQSSERASTPLGFLFGNSPETSGDTTPNSDSDVWWEFDRSNPRWTCPWNLSEVQAEAPSLDPILQEVIEDLAASGVCLTFGMTSHEAALRATKHFVSVGNISVAVSSSGRSQSLSDVPLVFKPGDYDTDFTALNTTTQQKIQKRKETIVSERTEKYQSDIEDAIDLISRSDQLPVSKKQSLLNTAKSVLSNPHERFDVRGQHQTLNTLCSTIDELRDDSVLSRGKQNEVINKGTQYVDSELNKIQENTIEQAAQTVREAYSEQISKLTEQTDLSESSAKKRLSSHLPNDSSEDSQPRGVNPTHENDRLSVDVPIVIGVPLTVLVIIVLLVTGMLLQSGFGILPGFQPTPTNGDLNTNSGTANNGFITGLNTTTDGDEIVVQGTASTTRITINLVDPESDDIISSDRINISNNRFTHRFSGLSDGLYTISVTTNNTTVATNTRVSTPVELTILEPDWGMTYNGTSVSVAGETNADTVTVSLINQSGTVIQNQTISAATQEFNLTLEQPPPGRYQIQITARKSTGRQQTEIRSITVR